MDDPLSGLEITHLSTLYSGIAHDAITICRQWNRPDTRISNSLRACKLPTGYVQIARKIADRRIALSAYRLADFLQRLSN